MNKYRVAQNNPGGKWVINNNVAEYLSDGSVKRFLDKILKRIYGL